jgi:hypothetical protein
LITAFGLLINHSTYATSTPPVQHSDVLGVFVGRSDVPVFLKQDRLSGVDIDFSGDNCAAAVFVWMVVMVFVPV